MGEETKSKFSFDAQPDTGTPAGNTTLEKTKESYRERKPRSDRGKSRKQVLDEQIQRQAMEIDAMMTPENIEAIVCLPADIGLAVTGRELWKLDEKEVSAMSSTGAMAGKYFWQHDPKWLALAMFAVNIGMVYGTRLVLNFREARKEKREKRIAKPEKEEAESQEVSSNEPSRY